MPARRGRRIAHPALQLFIFIVIVLLGLVGVRLFTKMSQSKQEEKEAVPTIIFEEPPLPAATPPREVASAPSTISQAAEENEKPSQESKSIAEEEAEPQELPSLVESIEEAEETVKESPSKESPSEEKPHAPEVSAPTPTPPPPPSPEKETPPQEAFKYTVQVAAFLQEDYADRLIDKLKAKGYDAWLKTTVRSTGKVWYRVMVGHFNSRDEAAKIRVKMQDEGFLDAFIVTLK